jgi:hypothetical protein
MDVSYFSAQVERTREADSILTTYYFRGEGQTKSYFALINEEKSSAGKQFALDQPKIRASFYQ